MNASTSSPTSSSSPTPRVCPVTGRVLDPKPEPKPRLGLLGWVFSGMGLASLIWFVVRVLPKPSRATYPCQRVAFPVASSFVVWLLAVLGSAFAWRKARARDGRFWRVCLWSAAAAAGCVLVVTSLPTLRTWAGNPPHGPLGVAKGIFPGRVAWVHAPGAVSWDGYTSPEHWYDSNHCDQATVALMLSEALQSVGGTNSDAAAWDAIFKYYNQNHAKGSLGYQTGEKIAIKINLTTCNARSGTSTVDINGTYEKNNNYDGHWLNSIDAAPQLLLSLLRELVNTAGVPQTNISMGDPTGNFPKYLWDRLHPEFPNVVYFDNYGGQGRARVQLSAVPFYWSVTNQTLPGTTFIQDFVPVPFAQADYLIDLAVPKSHARGGITACGKNYYGALLRCPDGYSRDAGGPNRGYNTNYSDMHQSLSDMSPGLGRYHALVDLMGHPNLGGKMLLCIGDMLFSGQDWAAHPYKWNTAPFNTNWPSSLFVSQDPVAIDSVCYDFLLNEWPTLVDATAMAGGAEDFLHEAAQASSPASGTFYDPAKTGTRLASLGVHEHWNNATEKKYSRNLDPVNGTGIELVAINGAPAVSITPTLGQHILAWQGLGYDLQTTTNASASNFWSRISPLPPAVQNLNLFTNTSSEPFRFYRLSRTPPPPPATNSPYGNNGNPWAISATATTRIEAENYDNGGEGVAYHDADPANQGGQFRTAEGVDVEATTDTGGGYNVGWTAAGEWLKYTVNVANAGTYSVKLRVAGGGGVTGGPVRVWFDAVNKTGDLTTPNTGGWQTWADLSKTGVALSAGRQVMKIEMVGGNFNLNWIEFTRTGP